MDADGCVVCDGIGRYRLEIEGVRANQYRFADSAGFDQVLTSQFFETSSDEGEIASCILHEHFSHGIAQQDTHVRRNGALRHIAQCRSSGHGDVAVFDHARDIVETLWMSRNQQQ